MTDWTYFKTELEIGFEDADNEIYLYRRLLQLCQMHSFADYTRTFCTVVLELATHAVDSKAQVFHYIKDLKDNIKS